MDAAARHRERAQCLAKAGVRWVVVGVLYGSVDTALFGVNAIDMAIAAATLGIGLAAIVVGGVVRLSGKPTGDANPADRARE